MDIFTKGQYKKQTFLLANIRVIENTQHKHMTGYTFVLNKQQENFGGKNDLADAGTTDDVM